MVVTLKLFLLSGSTSSSCLFASSSTISPDILSSACTCFVCVVVCSLTLVVKSLEPKPDEALKKISIIIAVISLLLFDSSGTTILIP